MLKTGGILRCQMNGLPPHAKQYDTWSGVRIAPEEIRQFARENDLQLLALEQIWTQYMWITCRKRPAAGPRRWPDRRVPRAPRHPQHQQRADRRGRGAGCAGRWRRSRCGSKSLPDGVRSEPPDGHRRRPRLPPDVHRRAGEGRRRAGERRAARRACAPGWCRWKSSWLGQPVCAPGVGADHARRARPVPRITPSPTASTCCPARASSAGSVKVTMHEVADAAQFHATVDGRDALEIESFCADPISQRYEFNFPLPESIGPRAARSAGRAGQARVRAAGDRGGVRLTRWLAAGLVWRWPLHFCWRPRRAAASCNCPPGTVEMHRRWCWRMARKCAARASGTVLRAAAGFSRTRADRGARRRRAAARFRNRRQSRRPRKRAPDCRRYDVPFARFTPRQRRAGGGGCAARRFGTCSFREIAGFAVLVSRSRGVAIDARAGGRQRVAQRRRAATTLPAASCWKRAPPISA